MVVCSNCGEEVPNAKFCKNCGFKLQDEENNDNQKVDVKLNDDSDSEFNDNSESKKTKYCSNCGFEVDSTLKFCPNCGFNFEKKSKPQNYQQNTVGENEKNIVVSIILSLIFPGLAQAYLNLPKKAITFIIAYVISAFLILILVGFILCVIVWVWALVDAIQSNNAINEGKDVEDKLFN